MLPDRDSNPDEQIQSLSCYRYTIGQRGFNGEYSTSAALRQ